jgi:hypothetical protein
MPTSWLHPVVVAYTCANCYCSTEAVHHHHGHHVGPTFKNRRNTLAHVKPLFCLVGLVGLVDMMFLLLYDVLCSESTLSASQTAAGSSFFMPFSAEYLLITKSAALKW